MVFDWAFYLQMFRMLVSNKLHNFISSRVMKINILQPYAAPYLKEISVKQIATKIEHFHHTTWVYFLRTLVHGYGFSDWEMIYQIFPWTTTWFFWNMFKDRCLDGKIIEIEIWLPWKFGTLIIHISLYVPDETKFTRKGK